MSGRDRVKHLPPSADRVPFRDPGGRKSTLAEELPRQQGRCRTILERAVEIGPNGAFLAAMLRQSLARAEAAAAAGDIAAMIVALHDLQSYSE